MQRQNAPCGRISPASAFEDTVVSREFMAGSEKLWLFDGQEFSATS